LIKKFRHAALRLQVEYENACAKDAYEANSERRPLLTYVITEPCIGTKDQSCVEVCPVDCIYDGGDQFFINPEECIDCGACEPECPVEAIYPEDEVPEDMLSYVTKASDFFE
jgi:NAD-dependent dihydropyrimidine dehydrogenase PreA subunit